MIFRLLFKVSAVTQVAEVVSEINKSFCKTQKYLMHFVLNVLYFEPVG